MNFSKRNVSTRNSSSHVMGRYVELTIRSLAIIIDNIRCLLIKGWMPVSLTAQEEQTEILPESIYECVRCGERLSASQLTRMQGVRSICGYTVFRKVRSSAVKQLKAA